MMAGKVRRKFSREDIKRIAKELYRTKTFSELAEELSCSVQGMKSIVKKLEANGVKFPKQGNVFELALSDLKRTDPELFKEFNPKVRG